MISNLKILFKMHWLDRIVTLSNRWCWCSTIFMVSEFNNCIHNNVIHIIVIKITPPPVYIFTISVIKKRKDPSPFANSFKWVPKCSKLHYQESWHDEKKNTAYIVIMVPIWDLSTRSTSKHFNANPALNMAHKWSRPMMFGHFNP